MATVPRDVQGFAYVLLLAQEQAKNPGLTPEAFNEQLRARIKEGNEQARAQKEKK